ncbi:Reverse transcriptase domain [Arabidopsis thaliana x Arabidopsis arenosa]|uniref:Reverse transcriptase domain n=1 Tax=Arabidopsis thaliana x Arabidopsis arenosa TaxID=1240361 RepID=A0A8T2EWW7_9BRAS|nr:Reverse transcriptase domain [Arabidopsis thaliana x Arabidopsis arenosa]
MSYPEPGHKTPRRSRQESTPRRYRKRLGDLVKNPHRGDIKNASENSHEMTPRELILEYRGPSILEESHNTPFTHRISDAIISDPGKLRIEHFNGSSDPKGNLKSFIISVARAKFRPEERDAGLCHLFVEHLKGPALDWFSRLEGNSVDSFLELSTLFVEQYSVLIDPDTLDADLWSLSQQPNEPLRDFLAKLRSTLAKVEGINDVAALSALKKSLWYKSEFQKELNLFKPLTIRDALHRASDYVSNEEEMELLAKRHEPTKQTPRTNKPQPGAPNHKKSAQGGTFVHHEGRNFSGAHNYQADTPRGEAARGRGRGRGRGRSRESYTWTKDQPAGNEQEYCELHKSYDHHTSRCRSLGARLAAKFLAGEIGGGLTIEDLEAEKGKTEQTAPAANPDGHKRGRGNRETDDDEPEAARDRIFTILGDSAFCQDTTASIKAYQRKADANQIGGDLGEELTAEVTAFLKENINTFACSPEDLPGVRVNVVSHELNIDPTFKPIKQKRRKLGRERAEAVKAEIGKTMEVYIDDMLVKSMAEKDHITHLRECFKQLNLYNVKLNLAKCRFGVRSGEFLGYLVTHRGIEANPKQIEALLGMASPQNKREVQRLTGRVAALNRFISRSTDKCLAFYDVLRRNKKFEWTTRCEEAFQELKKYLATPPILAKPVIGEPLYLYIAVLDTAFSGVLVREDRGEQKPIVYVSANGETCFSSRRQAKWAIELDEYDIEYRNKTCAKSQVLADFIVELPTKEARENPLDTTWLLHVDGSSSKQGSGVGIRLTSPTGEILEQSFRLNFEATNNLVANQFNGEYTARDKKMEAYLVHVQKLAKNFEEFELTRIPRGENTSVDALAALASTSDPSLRRVIPVEFIEKPSIELSEEEHVVPIQISADQDDPDECSSGWMEPIISYISEGKLPSDKWKARKLKAQAARFVLVDEKLYKWRLSGPLMNSMEGEATCKIMKQNSRRLVRKPLWGKSFSH